jgi:hypothetical protein
MATTFSPAPVDVARYQRLRNACRALNNLLVPTIPAEAWEDIGEALGILHRGALVLDSEDMIAVVADCCLFNWPEKESNLVERYADDHPAPPGSDEAYVLNAYRRQVYRVLGVVSVVPGAGAYCQDPLEDEDIFVMDMGLSRTAHPGFMLATRTFPIDGYWITGGAALPLDRDALDHAERCVMDGEPDVELAIIRGCLGAGAAERVQYRHAKSFREPKDHRFGRRRKRHGLCVTPPTPHGPGT